MLLFPPMVRDFFDFLWSLWQEWKALLTGGSIVALVFLYTVVSKKQLPYRVYWCILALTLVIAAFFSWRRARVEGGAGLVEVDVHKLSGVFHEETGVHAKLYVKQYIGKRVRLTGKLSAVNNIAWMTFVYVEVVKDFSDVTIRFTLLRGLRSASNFTPLRRGTSVTVEGRIIEIAALGIQLSGVSLVSVNYDLPT